MRNNSLDILKFICAILVIFIHTPQPTSIELIIDPLQRCAVPIFFIISGYFTLNRPNLNKVLANRINSIVKILCWALALYLTNHIIHHQSIDIINTIILNIKNLVFCNNILYGEHLWYIHAYLYVLIIFWMTNKYNCLKFLVYITPILIIAGLYLGKYHEMITGNQCPVYYSRNFLFTGLPFYILGILIKKNETLINQRISKNIVIVGAIAFLTMGSIEELAFNLYNKSGDLYISTAFTAVALFIFFLRIKCEKENFITRIGKNDSLYLYILHVFFFNEISFLITELGYEELLQYISIIITPIITIVFIRILRKFQIIGKLI